MWHVKHQEKFTPRLNLNIDYQKVSDSAYYRDLGQLPKETNQSYLPQKFTLSHDIPYGKISLGLETYQTLQDPKVPVDTPYKKYPELIYQQNFNFVPSLKDFSIFSSWTKFEHQNKVSGSRLVVFPTWTRRWQRSYGYAQPKVAIHYTDYDIDHKRVSRTIPIFSFDSGLTFEKEYETFNGMVQTLEPRLFYVNIPTVNQNHLPNFDTSENDFSWTQLFTENRFSGQDRINPANQLTTGLTSRLIDYKNGLERLRIAAAKRFYIQKDKNDINLSGQIESRKENATDILVQLGGDLTNSLKMDGDIRYNDKDRILERIQMQWRYEPSPFKKLNVRYRIARNETLLSSEVQKKGRVHMVDVSSQWNILPNWNMLYRNQYSLRDRKSIDHLLGLEYQSCCWSIRFGGQRYTKDLQSRRNFYFVQFELKGIGSLGSDPIKTLRESIPGYKRPEF
jgi:LPS-assembly protein